MIEAEKVENLDIKGSAVVRHAAASACAKLSIGSRVI